jgi:hypothetical protein
MNGNRSSTEVSRLTDGDLSCQPASQAEIVAAIIPPRWGFEDSFGRPTQGAAPRRFEACPRLNYGGPVGLKSPNKTAPCKPAGGVSF